MRIFSNKRFFVKSLFLIFIFGAINTACTKYDEGPSLSLRSINKRITGTWIIDNILINSIPITEEQLNSQKNERLLIFPDNTGKSVYLIIQDEVIIDSLSIDFNWNLSEDKLIYREQRQLGDNLLDWTESKIIKLSNSEFWIQKVEETEMYVWIEEFRYKKIRN